MGANENDYDGDIYLNRIYRIYIGENRSDIDYLISLMDSNMETIYAEPEYLRKLYIYQMILLLICSAACHQ